ncbi:MAG: PEGA domain-containing protein [Fibrobacter sp.]|nr:PEGA domain-containing protein [Fibrobacter sp.]
MKKVILLLAASLMAHAFAEDPQGKQVMVELVSGTKQKAQFLGIENDTVSLGGYIKNEFTVLKFPKSQFKSILDSLGNNILAAPSQDTPAVQAAQDSAQEYEPVDPNAPGFVGEETGTEQVAEANPEPPAGEYIPDKVFIGYESDGIDSSKGALLTALTFEIMQEIDPRFGMRGYSATPQCNDRACVQDYWKTYGVKDIYFGKISRAQHPDSANVEITRVLYEEELPTISKEQVTLSLDSLLQDAVKDGSLVNLVKKAAGFPIPSKRKRSYIHVETDPESATISRPEKDAICKSPCTFAVTDTGKIEINAYWNVDKHLWGAQTFVRPLPGDTVKVSLKLKRVIPEIKIVSNPVGAEIFPGTEEITRDSKSIGTTPKIISLTNPGMTHLRLRREGYRDTLVNFYVAPVSEINLDISMEHLTDFEEIRKQEEWAKQRRISFIGKAMMGSSIAPVLAGALLLYLAQQNYDDADDIKAELKMPSAAKGENYNRKKQKNKDLVDTGDRYSIIGGSLIGAGIAVFGLGLFLTF